LDNINRDPKKQENKTISTGVSMGQMSELRSSFNPYGAPAAGPAEGWAGAGPNQPANYGNPNAAAAARGVPVANPNAVYYNQAAPPQQQYYPAYPQQQPQQQQPVRNSAPPSSDPFAF